MTACQAGLTADRVRQWCGTAATSEVTLVCVHEHIFTAQLCAYHNHRVDDEGRCIFCGSIDYSGERRHACKVRTVLGRAT